MNKTIKVLLITFISFATYFIIDEMYFRDLRKLLFELIHQFGISHIIAYTVFGVPIFIGILLLHSPANFFKSLGFNRSLLTGLLFSLICTLPMFIGFYIVFDFNIELSLNTILISVIAAAIFEELYFRGFLFGQLFRYSKLGFIPSVFLGALLFGLGHLYQSSEFTELIGIFLVTFLGGILFAWVYVEWNYNLWIPIFLHMFMNLSWELFSVSDNAFGGMYSNVFRLITIAFIIMLTIVYKKKKGIKFIINKNTIWMTKTGYNKELS